MVTRHRPSLWNPPWGIIKCKCSSDITQARHKIDNTSTKTSKGSQQQGTTCRPVPSCGTLEFRALSLSSDVSLLTALPLLVLRRTLNARFNLRKERLLTEDRSKFLTVKAMRREREALYRLLHAEHARTCLNLPPHSQSSAFSSSF